MGDIKNSRFMDKCFTGTQVSDKVFLHKDSLKYGDITLGDGDEDLYAIHYKTYMGNTILKLPCI